MSLFYIVDPILGAQGPVSLTNSVRQHPLGYLARGQDMSTGVSSANRGAGMFIYAQGSNQLSIGQFVHISNNSAVLLASANSTCFWPIGVAAGVLSGTGCFGWVQVQGICDYATASNTSIAANAYIALGSTAGQVGTVTALGSRINGIAVPTSFTSSQVSATVYLDFPKLIGITASN